VATFSLPAASVKHGNERLRELAVFPRIDLNLQWGVDFMGSDWVTPTEGDSATQFNQLREQLKQEPENVRALIQLGLFWSAFDQTNEAFACYQKAEQICRREIEAHPQDGSHLTELGAVLSSTEKFAESESAYRKAVLVSSNDWRCWAGLGHFLNRRAYSTLI